jgi:aromatic-L-amino-acid/L-tryptophan decarboxylase
MENDFYSAAQKITEWMNRYQQEVEKYPVLSQAQPGDILKQLPLAPPEAAEPFERIFADFEKIILPGITHWQHPAFFGYFPSNSSPPSILAEMLIASLGVQGMSWCTSPAATELEVRMMEWLRQAFGLPADFSGVIQGSASDSTLAAMVTARERATNFLSNEEGLDGRRLVSYCSAEAHSSIEKAAKIIGLGRCSLRKIPVNARFEMRTDLLEKALEEDKRSGLQPFFVVGAFGTTGSTAVDNLEAIGAVARKHGLWFHVDAAYSGSALVLPEIRPLARGIETADSVVVNPHKWLMTTFDCSSFFVRDRDALVRSFAILPEYLKTAEAEPVTNFRDWGPGLGRRFRSLKLWFVLRWFGVQGLRNLLRGQIRLAARLEAMIAEDPGFELMAPREFNLVCFRKKGSDEENLQLMGKLNASGELFLTHTKLNGCVALRLVLGQTTVDERHMLAAWAKIKELSESPA